MRKILSAALALVCIWFATPALADLDPCRNLLDPEWTQNKGTDGNNGNVVNSAGWSITDLIPVEPGQYVWSMSALYQTYTFYYDTNKQFISPHGGPKDTQERQITIPSNAKYVRLQIKAVGDSLSSMQQQLERGDTATAYTPYNPLCATCDGTVVNYTSATGTGVQNGTPTPDNPIEPVFYQQGNMVLRKVGDYADTYDATTGKITRRVGVKVLDGTENWRVYSTDAYATNPYFAINVTDLLAGGNPDTKLFCNMLTSGNIGSSIRYKVQYSGGGFFVQPSNDMLTVENFKSWLAQQYAAGTPVTIYYPLAEETTEDWPASYCETPIKIATTKYNETAFSPLNTALANAISVVDTVVSNTITQAGRIATLQAQKQTRPNDIADDNEKCPAYKQCLLVEDEQGVPHWYEITDPFRDFVTPIIANNVNAASSTSTNGYTQLEYIESTGTQYIDTGVVLDSNKEIEIAFQYISHNGTYNDLFGISSAGSIPKSYLFRVDKSGKVNIYIGRDLTPSFALNNNKHTIKTENKKVYFDNESKGSYDNMASNPINAYLFATNLDGAAFGVSVVKIYYTKIWNNGTLVRNFVPVVNNTTGKIGMYDTVGGRFYGNAATSGDDFTAGPIVENDADVPGMSWSATWAADATTGVSAGTVNGIARCNNYSSTAGSIITNTASTAFNTLGSICHCKMTSIDFEGSISDTNTAKWVHVDHANGGTKVCLQQCGTWCRGFTTITERNKPVLSSVL